MHFVNFGILWVSRISMEVAPWSKKNLRLFWIRLDDSPVS